MARCEIALVLFGSSLLFACDGGGVTGGGGGGPSGGGGSDDGGGGSASEGGAPSTGGSGFGGDVGSGGSPATGGGGRGDGGSSIGGSSGEGGTPNPGLSDVGTLVILGDSISDGGGQSPFYYDLLRAKLETRYGAIDYRRKAQSGSKTNALVGQIDDLPSSLPGPVVVAITSGGNDMKAALPLILSGGDQAARTQMGQNIGAALDALLEPGRFGSGVEVHVYEANIYDASDGQGDFGQNGCAFGNGLPPIASDGFFANWNSVIEGAVSSHAQQPMDMHGYFYGHGYHSTPNWYASDCTHPSSTGHAALADFFYSAISGESP